MYIQENKFICSIFSRIYCLVFFSHVLGIDQINDMNKFVESTKFIVPNSKCAAYQILRVYAVVYFLK